MDLGPATVRDYADAAEGITTLPERTCWGASTTGDSACYQETRAKPADVGRTVVSRGWADLGNHASALSGRPLTPGRPYTITLDLAATDHVVPAGHRLALIIAGTDRGPHRPSGRHPDAHPGPVPHLRPRPPLTGGATAFTRATG
ncbi:hypothetical protein GCM10020295_12320 [Streptomyces cinereospinus]